MKRYSQMTTDELKITIKELEKILSAAETNKLESEASIQRQKINLAKSYLIDPKTISTEKQYQIKGYSGLFHVQYLNGIYAWGSFEGSARKEAFPLSLLER